MLSSLAAVMLSISFNYRLPDPTYTALFEIQNNDPVEVPSGGLSGCVESTASLPPSLEQMGLHVSSAGIITGTPTQIVYGLEVLIDCDGNQSSTLSIDVVTYDNTTQKYSVILKAKQLARDNSLLIFNDRFDGASTSNPTLAYLRGKDLDSEVQSSIQLPRNSKYWVRVDVGLSHLRNQDCWMSGSPPYAGNVGPDMRDIVIEWDCKCKSVAFQDVNYDGLTCPDPQDPLHGQLFVYVVVAIGCCILAMMCWKKQYGDQPAGWQRAAHQPLLMREEVEDMYKEGSWECDVCRFQNDPHSKSCVMCGSLRDYLTARGSDASVSQPHWATKINESRADDMSSWSVIEQSPASGDSSCGTKKRERSRRSHAHGASGRESGSITRLSTSERISGSFVAAQSSSLLVHGWGRQQSFAVKRLNRLNQRQMGARRRHQWIRKAGEDGQLHWHRNTDTTPLKKKPKPDRNSKKAMEGEAEDEVGPNEAADAVATTGAAKDGGTATKSERKIKKKERKKNKRKKKEKNNERSSTAAPSYDVVIDLDTETTSAGSDSHVIDLDNDLDNASGPDAGANVTATSAAHSRRSPSRFISSFLNRKHREGSANSGREGSSNSSSGSSSGGAGAGAGVLGSSRNDEQFEACVKEEYSAEGSSDEESSEEEDNNGKEEEEEQQQAGSADVSFTDNETSPSTSRHLTPDSSRHLLSLEEPCDLYTSVTSVASVLNGREHSRGTSTDVAAYSGGAGQHSGSGSRMNSASLSVGFVGQFRTDEGGRPADGMTFVEAQHATPSRCLPQNFLVEIEAEDLEYIASLPFKDKYRWFLQQTAAMKQAWEEGHIEFEIDRKNLLDCSVQQLHELPVGQLNQSMRVTFKGEPAIDAGGLEREWFMLLSDIMFAETTGLFRATHIENLSYTINPCSVQARPDHLDCFHALGRLLGRALFEGQQITAHMSLPLLKHLLGVPISFSDLQFIDAQLFENLANLKKTSDVHYLCLDFTAAEENADGTMRIVELKSDGANVDVTDENKAEYVKLRLRHIMLSSISSQLRQLLRGLYEVIPQELITIFDYQELELMLNGVPEINLEDWQEHTQVAGLKMEQVIEWFWEIVTDFDHEERARLLQFSTGSTRVPVQGFKSLQANDGRICPFTLNGIHLKDCAFPRAHTCFNRIDLPKYESKDDLLEAITLVINMELTGFTME